MSLTHREWKNKSKLNFVITGRQSLSHVAGAVVEGEAADVAHDNGMYIIVQSGEAVNGYKILRDIVK